MLRRKSASYTALLAVYVCIGHVRCRCALGANVNGLTLLRRGHPRRSMISFDRIALRDGRRDDAAAAAAAFYACSFDACFLPSLKLRGGAQDSGQDGNWGRQGNHAEARARFAGRRGRRGKGGHGGKEDGDSVSSSVVAAPLSSQPSKSEGRSPSLKKKPLQSPHQLPSLGLAQPGRWHKTASKGRGLTISSLAPTSTISISILCALYQSIRPTSWTASFPPM